MSFLARPESKATLCEIPYASLARSRELISYSNMPLHFRVSLIRSELLHFCRAYPNIHPHLNNCVGNVVMSIFSGAYRYKQQA